MKPKLLVISTISLTLYFFKGQINYLKQYFDVELVSSPDERLTAFSESEMVKANPIPMRREISVLRDIVSLYRMGRLFLKIRPNMIHGNTPKAGLISMLAGWLTRVPKRVYYIHGLRYEGASGFKQKVLMQMERISCALATNVFCVSNGVKDKLKEDNITSKNVVVIANGSINGIDPAHFNPALYNKTELRSSYEIPDNSKVLGYVGRLVGDKGINELIEAFSLVNKKDKRVILILVGNFEDQLDPIKTSTKEIIETHKDILAVGFQADIRPFLSMMDVFVFPSYREGFGVSLMEAGCMGLPVISTDITGCNEIVEPGYNGLLIESKSHEQLVYAIESVLNDSQCIKSTSDEIRNYITTKYNQQKIWSEAATIYKNLVN